MEGSQLTPTHYYLPPPLRKSAAARPGGHIQPLRHHLVRRGGGEEGRGGEGESHLKVADLQQSAGLTVVILNTDQIHNSIVLFCHFRFYQVRIELSLVSSVC